MVEAIIPFWLMARTETMTRQNCLKLFVHLHDKHKPLMKTKGRASDSGGQRSGFVLELDSLVNTGATDAVKDIECNRLLSREMRKSGSTRTTGLKGKVVCRVITRSVRQDPSMSRLDV